MVFYENGRSSPQPEGFFVGVARSASSLRGFDDELIRLIEAERKLRKMPALEKRLAPMPDTPLQMKIVKHVQSQEEQSNYSSYKQLYMARRGRRAALHGSRVWGSDEERRKLNEQGLGRALAQLLSTSRASSAMQHSSAGAESTSLLRGVLHFAMHTSGEHIKFTPDRADRMEKEMRQAGMFGWKGAEARLEVRDGALHETWESHDKGIEETTIFRAIRGDQYGLGDVADHLPADAMAAMRVAADDKMLSEWLNSVCTMARSSSDYAAFLGVLRPLLGLDKAAPERGLVGVPELNFCLLPQAAGAIAPEMCFLLRVDEKNCSAEAFIARLADVMKGLPGGDTPALKPKKLGRGDDAVPYVDLKVLVAGGRRGGMSGMNTMSMVFKAALGGGFISATRVGPYLAIGCNPRTVRKFKRRVAKGDTLAKQQGFAAKFPKGSGRFLEGWFDWKRIVSSASVIDTVMPMAMLAASAAMPRERVVIVEGGRGIVAVPPDKTKTASKPAKTQGKKTAAAPGLPTTKDIAALVGTQYIYGSKTDFGNRIRLEGSLVLSPLSISAVTAGAYFFDAQVGLMLRRW